MFRHVPNALTGARLILAGVFFVMLGYYQYEGRGDPRLLNLAFVIYCVALFTDFLDGYLARRWKVEGAFGRVVDPFVDKILVIGSFVFFAGKNFIIPETGPGEVLSPHVVRTISGVAPGMVIVILARELLVTSLRGLSESSGRNFGAAFSGKLKMVFQSATILVILVYVNYVVPRQAHWHSEHPGGAGHPGYYDFARYFRDFCIWATMFITVYSGLLYVRRAVGMYRAGRAAGGEGGAARAGPAVREAGVDGRG